MSKREEFWARVNEKGESLNQQTKGILGQMSENAMGLRGIECEGIWRRANAIEWGKSKEFTANRQMWGVLGKPRRSFEPLGVQVCLEHKEYWRTGNAGSLGQTSEGMQWVWGESKAKGFDGE